MMKSFFVFLLLVVLSLAGDMVAKETIYTQLWIKVPTQTKLFPDYTFRKSTTTLEAGNYQIVAEGSDYYQLESQEYVKKDKQITTFKVIFTPEGLVSPMDTADEHRAKVDVRIAEETRINPYIWIFFGLVLVMMLIMFIIN